jgi:hypothetical protein
VRNRSKLLCVLFTILAPGSILLAQQNANTQANLLANTAVPADNSDSKLSVPWRTAFVGGPSFVVVNNNGGVATLYDARGNKTPHDLGILSASPNPRGPGGLTGIVANPTTDCGAATFPLRTNLSSARVDLFDRHFSKSVTWGSRWNTGKSIVWGPGWNTKLSVTWGNRSNTGQSLITGHHERSNIRHLSR